MVTRRTDPGIAVRRGKDYHNCTMDIFAWISEKHSREV
jgi:hypothetical protein